MYEVIGATVPHTAEWSPWVACIMIASNIFAIFCGKVGLPDPSVGLALPYPKMFGGMGLTALLGTMSLGHVIGFGIILGLGNIGVL